MSRAEASRKSAKPDWPARRPEQSGWAHKKARSVNSRGAPRGRAAAGAAADSLQAASTAAAADSSSLQSDSTDFFLFIDCRFFSLTVGQSSESASVAPPSRNLAGMPACRRGGRADREGSGGLAIIVAKYNRAPGNRDVAGRRVRAWSLRFLTHPDVKNSAVP